MRPRWHDRAAAQRRYFGAGVVLFAVLAALVWWCARDAAALAPLACEAAAGGDLPAVVVAVRAAALPGEVPAPSSVRADAATTDPVVAVGPATLASWVEELRDDGVPWNAEQASWRLASLPPGPLPAVEAALDSADLQQRHLAARLLRRRSVRFAAVPSPRLLDVSVDVLARRCVDALVARRLCGAWNPDAEATRFLAAHAVAARAPLRRALHSGDQQQRFLAAWLLAQSEDTGYADTIARELLPHLADNDIAGDAIMAANGLYRLGPSALPALRWWRQHVDAQARALIDTIERDLASPPRSRRDLAQRRPAVTVTALYHDPAIEFDVQRSRVPSWRTR